MILFEAELTLPELGDQLYFYNISTIKACKLIICLIELLVYKLKQLVKKPTKSL